jgi:hypothetical protein
MPHTGSNRKLNCFAAAGVSVLKNAPLSATKSASLPLIAACTSGRVPSMVTGNSAARPSLHGPADAGLAQGASSARVRATAAARQWRSRLRATSDRVLRHILESI